MSKDRIATQIKHLNAAAKRNAGMSFLSLTFKGHHTLADVVHEAMESYALACLEKAAENAKARLAGFPEAIEHANVSAVVVKESITNKENLI